MLSVYVFVVLGAVLAGFVQGLSGFAFGLTAMSIWAWTLEPQLAAQLAIFGALTGQLVAVFTTRRALQWRLLRPFLLGGLLGVPLGVWLLPLLDAQQFKSVVGAILVVFCPLMLLAPRMPRIQRGGRIGDAISGLLGGVLSGLSGFSGVAPTLWSMMRGLAREEQRAVIQNFNLSVLFVSFSMHVWQGHVTVSMLPFFALVALAVLVPVLLGVRLYRGLSEQAFRRVVLGVLTLSGLAMLLS